MSKFKEMKFLVGYDANEKLSTSILNSLEAVGYDVSNGREFAVDANIILARDDGEISTWSYMRDDDDGFFKRMRGEEINVDWMRAHKAKPETIELAGKTYIKSELEEALRHIKPVDGE